MVGQVATESKAGKVSRSSEQKRSSILDPRRARRWAYRFSQLYLWGIETGRFDLHPIKERLHQLIGSQDQLQDIIVAPWGQRGAVVTRGGPATLSPSQFPSIQD